MGKLWDKGYELNKVVERFTVGDDFKLDLALVRWDCVGSIAHAAMLTEIGILTKKEYARLRKRLIITSAPEPPEPTMAPHGRMHGHPLEQLLPLTGFGVIPIMWQENRPKQAEVWLLVNHTR